LDIELKVENVVQGTEGPLGPTTNRRAVKDTVVVKDQESLVIGGLVSDDIEKTESKVPLLGDIPILGHLFKRTATKRTKKNLLILLTPYVLSDRADRERITAVKRKESDEFTRSLDSLRSARYEPHIDYSRKRGLIEEIQRSVKRVEEEKRLLQELEQRP